VAPQVVWPDHANFSGDGDALERSWTPYNLLWMPEPALSGRHGRDAAPEHRTSRLLAPKQVERQANSPHKPPAGTRG
jgi:hypothetical protein